MSINTINENRGARFVSALKKFVDGGNGKNPDKMTQEQVDEELTDLMADMQHWYWDRFGEPVPDKLNHVAYEHCEAERVEEERRALLTPEASSALQTVRSVLDQHKVVLEAHNYSTVEQWKTWGHRPDHHAVLVVTYYGGPVSAFFSLDHCLDREQTHDKVNEMRAALDTAGFWAEEQTKDVSSIFKK